MSFDFKKGKTIETPQVRERKSGIRKVGEFLAPTATKTIETLREGERPTLRQVAGTALEVGSLFVPAGAAVRGGMIAGRGAGVLGRTAQKVIKKPTQLEAITKGVQTVGRQAKTGARVGGITGGMMGAGRGLGEEDKPLTQVAGEAVTGAGLGALGGGILTPAVGLAGRGASRVRGSLSDNIKSVQARMNPTDRTQAVDDLTKSMMNSFVEDKPAIINKLEKISQRARFKGLDLDERGLLREVAEEGYMPEIKGDLGSFTKAKRNANTRIGQLSKGVERIAQRIDEKTPLSDIQNRAFSRLEGRVDVDFASAEPQFKRIFKSLQKTYGDELSAEDLNKIRIQMNKKTKSFGKEFVQDVSNAVGGATRERLDEFSPRIAELNAESSRLFRVIDTMEVLNNKKIDPGYLLSGVGRFAGVVGSGALGASVAGPGGLVVAGLMATGGSRLVANIVRQARFNPNIQNIIRQGLRRDKKLLNKVLKEANEMDRALIKRTLGNNIVSD